MNLTRPPKNDRQRGSRRLLLLLGSSFACAGCDGLVGVEDWLGLRDPQPILHASLPQAYDYGGPVLERPEVVPIFFSGDPHQSDVEHFLPELSKSSYWHAATREYGVGDLVVRPSIVVDEPPPTSTDPSDVEPWLATHLDGSHTDWPAPNQNQIYAMLYSKETVDPATGQTTCAGTTYHYEGFLGAGASNAGDGGARRISDAAGPFEADAGRGPSFLYAVILGCFVSSDLITAGFSHELIETSTDPFVQSNPAYLWVDGDHTAWSLLDVTSKTPSAYAEVSDLCNIETSFLADRGRLVGGFMVERSWSNRAAAENQDPCLPASPGVYFNAAPDLVDDVTVRMSDQFQFPTKGVRVPLHESRTVDVRLFSNGPGPDWYVAASEIPPTDTSSATLEFEWNAKSGNDGTILHLTITRIADAALGASQFEISSSSTPGDFDVSNEWLGFAGN